MKTLLVGLDAACWEYVEPLVRAGRMPTLQRLMSNGASGKLHSTLPAATPVAWSSIITGKNPGKHGIFDMMWRQPGSYNLSLTNNQGRRGRPFWQRLNEAGLRVGLVNVPFTYPPRPVNGFVVCGFGSPLSATDLTYPAGLQSQLQQRFGHFEPIVNPKLFRKGRPADILQAEIAHQKQLVEIACDLADDYQVDVLVINLMLPDHANHKMPEMAQVEEALCQSDRDAGRLIERFRPDNTLLISDHGSRRLQGDFLLHVWLRDNGYAVWEPRNPAGQQQALNWVIMEWLKKTKGLSGRPEQGSRWLMRQTLNRLPAKGLWQWLEKSVPLAQDHVRWSGRLDYAQSSLFFGNRSSGLLYLNIAGRDPAGLIPADRVKAFVEKLASQLTNITDPDGRPVLAGLYPKEQLYHGPALPQAPDLILDIYQSPWNTITAYRRQAIAESRGVALSAMQRPYFAANRNNYGWHSRDGIFAFSGPAFSSGRNQLKGHVMDIPATLLYLHNLPIPDDYDGQVMVDSLRPGHLANQPITHQPGETGEEDTLPLTYSDNESEELVSHLRALGYVD